MNQGVFPDIKLNTMYRSPKIEQIKTGVGRRESLPLAEALRDGALAPGTQVYFIKNVPVWSNLQRLSWETRNKITNKSLSVPQPSRRATVPSTQSPLQLDDELQIFSTTVPLEAHLVRMDREADKFRQSGRIKVALNSSATSSKRQAVAFRHVVVSTYEEVIVGRVGTVLQLKEMPTASEHGGRVDTDEFGVPLQFVFS